MNIYLQLTNNITYTHGRCGHSYNHNDCLPMSPWMDDVALISNDPKELQKMLNITHEAANRYHIEFGTAKSKILKSETKQPNQTYT